MGGGGGVVGGGGGVVGVGSGKESGGQTSSPNNHNFSNKGQPFFLNQSFSINRVRSLSIQFKLCMMIPKTYRYDLGIVATL